MLNQRFLAIQPKEGNELQPKQVTKKIKNKK